jgi:hypothetical protein
MLKLGEQRGYRVTVSVIKVASGFIGYQFGLLPKTLRQSEPCWLIAEEFEPPVSLTVFEADLDQPFQGYRHTFACVDSSD